MSQLESVDLFELFNLSGPVEYSRYREVIEQIPNLMWMSGINHDCLHCNKQWLEFTGRAYEKTLGDGWKKDIHPSDIGRLMQVYERTFMARERYSIQFRMRRHDGQYRWMAVNGNPIFWDEGKTFAGYLGSCVDIDDQKTLETELRKAKDEADAATKAKSDFLSIISHEIRTPLNGIVGLADLLKGELDEQKRTEYVELLSQSAQYLQTLINDVLDVAKLEHDHGNITLTNEVLDVVALVRSCVSIISPEATKKRLELKFINEASDSLHILVDQGRLKQVVINLLSNAVKFTDAGSVIVRFKIDECSCVIQIEDTGRGIPDEFKEKLGKQFSQADTSDSRNQKGTGLGLYISQAIVRAFGGTMEITDNVPRGTISKVAFPAVFASACKKEKTRTRGGPIHLRHRVLIVDDNCTNRLILCKSLNRVCILTDVASNGLEAIDHVKHNKYSIVFMDCQMPEVDGYEATKQIRKLGEAGSIPIIALTAANIPGDRERCLEAGMDDYITKPFATDQILAAIRKYAAGDLLD
jgi:PAS domain S-box-containing protein